MGKRNKVTTRDIAEYTGVSQSTVSMILSNKPHVSFSKETIDKVRQGAKELGYKKPVAGVKKKEQALAKSIIVICSTSFEWLLFHDHSFDHRTCQRLWLYRIYCQYIEGRLSRRTLFKPFIWV